MLTGKDLLAKVKDLGDVSKSDLVKACGYVSTKKGGGERLNYTAFYEALLEAKGVNLAAESAGGIGKGGRKLSYVATVQGLDAFGTGPADFWYASIGLPTGIEGLSVDLAADWVDWEAGGDDEIYQLYASYALSEKATVNARYEFGTSDENSMTDLESVAVGITYDLWDNVMSRVEYMTTSEEGSEDDDTLAFNLIYSF
mgnify:CR=1 FL=1